MPLQIHQLRGIPMKTQEVQDSRRTFLSRLALPLGLTILGSVLLTGCGGGGSNGNAVAPGTGGTGGGGTPTLQPAIAGLDAIVRGSQPTTVTSLSTIAGEFDQARQADPTNKDAQFGFAVTAAALAATQAANLTGTVVPAVRTASAEAALSPAARTASFSQGLVLWRLPQLLSGSTAVQWPQAADYLPTKTLQASLTPRASSPTPAQVQTEIAALDASLAKAEVALAVVKADPSYVYTLADPSQPANTASTVKVGSAEIQILSAVISIVRSLANGAVAYNADPGTFSFETPAAAGFSGASVGPAQYLPAAPFLTLAADGGTRLGAVKTELIATADSGTAAIESVKTRSNAGFLLNPGTLVTTGQLTAAEAQITAYKAYLTGAQTVPVGLNGKTVTTRVDLAAFLDHPPADLRTLLPTLPVSKDSSGATTLTMNGFPDLTFGGLFPDGLPVKSATYTLPVTSSTTYSQVIAFALTFQTS